MVLAALVAHLPEDAPRAYYRLAVQQAEARRGASKATKSFLQNSGIHVFPYLYYDPNQIKFNKLLYKGAS